MEFGPFRDHIHLLKRFEDEKFETINTVDLNNRTDRNCVSFYGPKLIHSHSSPHDYSLCFYCHWPRGLIAKCDKAWEVIALAGARRGLGSGLQLKELEAILQCFKSEGRRLLWFKFETEFGAHPCYDNETCSARRKLSLSFNERQCGATLIKVLNPESSHGIKECSPIMLA